MAEIERDISRQERNLWIAWSASDVQIRPQMTYVCTDLAGELKFVGRVWTMGRWPDDKRAIWTTVLLIFVLFPLLCVLAIWYLRG